MSQEHTHYHVLEVAEDASPKEIKASFFKKVREHPPEKDPEGHQRIREAYDVLSNPVSRREYDTMVAYGDKISQLEDEAERLLERENPDYEEAIKKLKQAVVLGPEIGLLRNQLGEAYFQNGQAEEALKQFNKAVELDKENSRYRLNRGYALQELDRLHKAERVFRNVWERDKRDYAAARALAGVLHQQERVDESHKVLDEAIWDDDKLDFEDFFCYYDKLQFYVADGETDVLKEELETVKDLPETEDDRRFAAYMLSKTGQLLIEINAFKLAEDFVNVAVELDPDDPHLQRIHEFVIENTQIQESVEKIIDLSSIHDFTKYAVSVFYQQYLGVVDDQEADEQIREINTALQNVMTVDPDNTEVKESVRHIRDQYPEVFQLNENAFEVILSMPEALDRVDDCPHCGEPIRFGKYETGQGTCTNCYNDVQISGQKIVDPNEGCFVATSVYGNYDHDDVMILRRFRNRVLNKSILGRAFISFYYHFGPVAAQYLDNHKSLKKWTRRTLEAFVDRLS